MESDKAVQYKEESGGVLDFILSVPTSRLNTCNYCNAPHVAKTVFGDQLSVLGVWRRLDEGTRFCARYV